MRWALLIRILLKRDIWPASDGSARSDNLMHWIGFYFLPTLGVLLLLFVIAFAGLWFASEEQAIEKSLKEAGESPYMALFVEGYMYEERTSGKRSAFVEHDPSNWESLTLGQLLGKKAPPAMKDSRVFNKVYPFSTAYLNIRMKNGEHLDARKGMALDFVDSEYRYERLIEKIKENILVDGSKKIRESAGGIYVSEAGLDTLGWRRNGVYPDYLYVRTSKYDDEIPLPVTVVKKLPYSDYILPMMEWRRLESGYYDRLFDGFKVIFPKGFTEKDKELLRNKLPEGSDIGDCYILGDADAVNVKLPDNSPLSRLDIMKIILIGNEESMDIRVGVGEPDSMIRKYGGAIFSLRHEIINEDLLELGLLQAMKKMLADKLGLNIRSALIETLEKAWLDNRRLARMADFFHLAYFAIGIILVVFFSITLHTRLRRIGALRMMGAPNGLFLLVHLLEGLIFAVSAFIVACVLFKFCMSEEIGFNLFSRQTAEILTLMAGCSTVGLILPSYWFLLRLETAEMMSFEGA